MPATPSSKSTAERGTVAARSPRRSRVLGVLGILAAIAVMSGVMTSCETTNEDRAAVIDRINVSRGQNGLPALSENTTLDIKADAWAQRLRNECNLSHSNLADGAPDVWRKLGENVGRGGSIDQIHTAYLNSPGHRANIMDPAFNYVGAAAVWGSCNGRDTLFTVQVFMKA